MELNKIHNIDCLEFMKTLPDKCIDMTLTSPPYDNLRDYNEFSFDFEGIAKELFRITKEGGVIVWVVGDAVIDGSESGTSFKQALFFKECGFRLHDTMIYQKNSYPFPPSNRYFNVFEYMFILSKGTPKTTNLIKVPTKGQGHKQSTFREKDGTMSAGKYEFGKDERVKDNIWIYDVGFAKSTNDKTAFEHPAIYPEKLCQDHIISWSNEGDIVFDPFMGSGTTGKIAQMLKRKWIGTDVSKEYCDIAEQRIKSISNPLF